jgi:hypothetical protein
MNGPPTPNRSDTLRRLGVYLLGLGIGLLLLGMIYTQRQQMKAHQAKPAPPPSAAPAAPGIP